LVGELEVFADRLSVDRLLLAPQGQEAATSLDELDPEVRSTFERLGISLDEQKRLSGVAVDAVFDSVSVATTFKGKLAELGIIFGSFSDAVKEHPELIQKYLGSVVLITTTSSPHSIRQSLRTALFATSPKRPLPDGALDLFPHQRRQHRAVRTYAHRCRRRRQRQLSGRLHGSDARREQLHAAVVELAALGRDSNIKYSTVQNWYPGDKEGKAAFSIS